MRANFFNPIQPSRLDNDGQKIDRVTRCNFDATTRPIVEALLCGGVAATYF
jgi:hypothetical protein